MDRNFPNKQEATCGCQRSKIVQKSSLEFSPARKRSRATSSCDLHKRPTCTVENEAWMFADDTKIYQELNCKEDGESLQNDLYRLEDWSKKWLLPFHPKKAKILKFGGAKKLEREYYPERGKLLPISSDNTETDLGVTFDSDLKLGKLFVNKVNKANRLVGLIKRTFQLAFLKFRFLFRGIVRPHLEYATSIWNPTSVKLQNLIENVQRRASKRVHEL